MDEQQKVFEEAFKCLQEGKKIVFKNRNGRLPSIMLKMVFCSAGEGAYLLSYIYGDRGGIVGNASIQNVVEVVRRVSKIENPKYYCM